MGSRWAVFDGRGRRWIVKRSLVGTIALLILATIVGCGNNSAVIPVSGEVTLDDQPLADAGVMFIPVEKGPVASGTTDAAGRFRLAAANTPGVQAGRYRVTITKQAVSGAATLDAAFVQGQTIQWLVPAKYSNPDSSELEATVSPEQYHFNFAITSR